MLILFGGTLHIYAFLTDDTVVATTLTSWAMITLVGVLCLIVGLAVYEKFGWAGGIIMGRLKPLACWPTRSPTSVMGVGVAGVKIAEVSITMGFDLMVTTSNPALMVVGLLLFLFIRPSPSPSVSSHPDHAARLHFVEWMGKFYSGTGRVSTLIGGRTLHTEGQSVPWTTNWRRKYEQEYPENEPAHPDRSADRRLGRPRRRCCRRHGHRCNRRNDRRRWCRPGLGLAAIGAGFSQAAIGSAAIGMIAEDGSKFITADFHRSPESIVILGALPLFLN